MSRIVEVEWEDSMSLCGWRSEEDVMEKIGGPDGDLCRSVGYVLRDKPPSALLIYQGRTAEADGEMTGAFVIPRAAIRRIRELEEAAL